MAWGHKIRCVILGLIAATAIVSGTRGQQQQFTRLLRLESDVNALLILVTGNVNGSAFVLQSGGETVDEIWWYSDQPFIKQYFVEPGYYTVEIDAYGKAYGFHARKGGITFIHYSTFDESPFVYLKTLKEGPRPNEVVDYFEKQLGIDASWYAAVSAEKIEFESNGFFFYRRPVPRPNIPRDNDDDGKGK